jgi:glucose-1-phosphate thymidylyltransferase
MQNNLPNNIIGIVPMAGLATRLGQLPCSKEIHPIAPEIWMKNGGEPPRVVCEYLLRKMQIAGITKVYIVIRNGKWDIPSFLEDGSAIGLNLAYLMMGLPYGSPYSIDQAYPFLDGSTVALGFPDMILGPGNIFKEVLEHQKTEQVDIVLGLFPTDRPDKVDMVEVNENKRITNIIIKPGQTDLKFSWGIAVWSPIFSSYMHNYLQLHQNDVKSKPELFVGDIIQSAINDGMRVEGIRVSDKPFLDIGTKDDLRQVI